MQYLGLSSSRPLENILAVVLGGGRGERLFPLTRHRAKPAVPIGGVYRLIDIPISNCINSGIHYIAVLTQYHTLSLYRHITNTYKNSSIHSGWVQVWAAEQTSSTAEWYQGTADAVRKQLEQIRLSRAPYILVLPGDQLYRMDFSELANFHWQMEADITIAVHPVSMQDCRRYGILKQEPSSQIVEFVEKPCNPALLKRLVSRQDVERPYKGSMGIYLFNTQVLIDLLENTSYEDFGHHLIPRAVRRYNVFGYDFHDYWEDIGTIRSYYEASLALSDPFPTFKLQEPERPIYRLHSLLPGPYLENCSLNRVLISEGCYITNATIQHSVIGPGTRIHDQVEIIDSIVMGNDCSPDAICAQEDGIFSTYTIESNCRIEGAIIDQNVQIGRGVTISPFPAGVDFDCENWSVRDGIVIIPAGVTIPPGTRIAPETLPTIRCDEPAKIVQVATEL